MRIFVPSWQLPGTWLENIEALAGEAWIEGIELLLFSWEAESRLAFLAEAARIAAYGERFAFSLHLPDPLPDDVGDLVAATSSFVERYVVHPWGDKPRSMRLGDWQAALDGLFADFGTDRFLLEYTGACPFAESSALSPDLAICADTGRLARDGLDPATWISERAGQIGEIHLHGTEGYRDHLPLTGEEAWLPPLLGLAMASDWIVDLETFSLAATKASNEAVKRWRR
jgi:hypothetical protein